MAVDVGSKAPDFTLTNQDRQPVKLSEQKGKPVVLAFFPAAFSGVFQDAQGYNFPLLSDFNKQAIKDYGVFNEDMIGLKGIAKRAVFVIDKDGIIRHKEVLDDARNEPNYDAVFRTLASLPQ